MVRAASAGIPAWRFWDLTYRELGNMLEGAAIRERMSGKNLLWQAWQMANFSRAKKLPNLGPLLRRLDPPRKAMDNRTLRAALIDAAKQMGARVIIKKKAPPTDQE